MTYLSNKNFDLEVAKGNVPGHKSVNKFGRQVDVDPADTDITDSAVPATPVWVAPTQARVHQIASTSASDTSAGVGAKTVQVYGLATWDTKESSEVITMNGTTDVATGSYVIIHRIKVLTKGTSGPNVGIITATADTDATVTAQINVGEGQTQMAIYGVPSTQVAYMKSYYGSAIKAAASLSVELTLLMNPEPDIEGTTFLVKHTIGIATEGTNSVQQLFDPPSGYSGPCILKMQANPSANTTDVSAGFDLILVDN